MLHCVQGLDVRAIDRLGVWVRALRAVMCRRVSVWVHKHDKHDPLFAPQRFFFVFINLYKLNIVENYIVQDHSRLRAVLNYSNFQKTATATDSRSIKTTSCGSVFFGQVWLGLGFFPVAWARPSNTIYCPLCILSNMGWLVDEVFAFEELLDNLNCSAAKDGPFRI